MDGINSLAVSFFLRLKNELCISSWLRPLASRLSSSMHLFCGGSCSAPLGGLASSSLYSLRPLCYLCGEPFSSSSFPDRWYPPCATCRAI